MRNIIGSLLLIGIIGLIYTTAKYQLEHESDGYYLGE